MITTMTPRAALLSLYLCAAAICAAGCSKHAQPSTGAAAAGSGHEPQSAPPAIQAWMDRLTVAHEYDPTTGFIVARETVALPPILADSPRLDSAVALAGSDRIVLAFATADRCAPCQQYKRDALNDETVIARLGDARFLPTHIEVDRSPELADAMLGSRGIPMTYALREGKVFAVLRGQRSAAQLLAWLDALARE